MSLILEREGPSSRAWHLTRVIIISSPVSLWVTVPQCFCSREPGQKGIKSHDGRVACKKCHKTADQWLGSPFDNEHTRQTTSRLVLQTLAKAYQSLTDSRE